MSSAPILLTFLNDMGRLVFDYVQCVALKDPLPFGFYILLNNISVIRAMGMNTQGRGSGSVMLVRVG